MKSLMSFIITRPNGKAHRFSMSSLIFQGVMFGSVLLLVLFFLSLALNVKLFIHYSNTIDETREQEAQAEVIKTLQNEVDSLRNIVEELLKKEEEIRQDLGKPKYRRLSYRKRIQRKERQFVRNYPKDDYNVYATHQLANEIEYIRSNVIRIEKKMRRHMDVFEQYKEWFDETPSIWPIYGYVRSGYGWRNHPLKKSMQFHKGIDIPAWIGAPVQATADGYVEFSGWGGGYGWIVVLSHKFGYKTIYAHLSEIEVNLGRKVFKGQIIGKIGTSGLSTGPHVHYEIRHRRKALEPSKYLNLDLFTAVSTLW